MRRLRLIADVLAVTDGADNRAAWRAFAGQKAAELEPNTSHSSRVPSPAPRPSPASSSTTRPSIASEAPDTAGRQHRPALVYDGDCGFCKRCAEWARRRLPQGNDVVAWQELPNLDALGLSVADVTRASYWIDAEGRPHRGEQGVAMALIEIGGFWTVVGRVLLLPPIRTLAAPLYGLIARHRHRLPGGSAACKVDDGAQGKSW